MKIYQLAGLSVIVLISIFAYFSDEHNAEYDLSGIVHDISSSTKGFIFQIDTTESSYRCFFDESPIELGYYAVRGSFSDDGGIFFIEKMMNMDNYKEHD